MRDESVSNNDLVSVAEDELKLFMSIVTEVRSRKGGWYQSKTLHEIVSSLQKY